MTREHRSDRDSTKPTDAVAAILSRLDPEGRWLVPLRTTSHPYSHDGANEASAGDFSHSLVGDETDTSPFVDPEPKLGLSTPAFVRNLGALINYVAGPQ